MRIFQDVEDQVKEALLVSAIQLVMHTKTDEKNFLAMIETELFDGART